MSPDGEFVTKCGWPLAVGLEHLWLEFGTIPRGYFGMIGVAKKTASHSTISQGERDLIPMTRHEKWVVSHAF